MRRYLLVCVIGVAALSSQAHAAIVEYEGQGLHANPDVIYLGENHRFNAGQILVRIDNGPILNAYCVDLDNRIRSEWTAELVNPTSVLGVAGGPAAYLFRNFAAGITTDDQAAGLQLALWEVVTDFDTGIDLLNGDFRVPDGEPGRAQAVAFLSNMPQSFDESTPPFVIQSGNSPRSQNLIVPEPGTMALLAMSVLAAAHRRQQHS